MPQNEKPTLTVADWPPTMGRPGLVQGSYGVAGNLELVVPAEDDGLWVGWFNNDPTESFQGAAIGRWSGVLRFASGARYVAAEVTQVEAGPDYIEVVAQTVDGELRRHVWSPDAGFVEQEKLATRIAATSALVVSSAVPGDGEFRIALIRTDGQLVEFRGQVGPSYPKVAFTEAAIQTTKAEASTASVDIDAAWHAGHLDIVVVSEGRATLRCSLVAAGGTDLGPARAARIVIGSDGDPRIVVLDGEGHAQVRGGTDDPWDLGPAEGVALAAVRRNERVHTDVVLRRGEVLWHAGLSAERLGSQALQRVRAEVWAADGQTEIHRG